MTTYRRSPGSLSSKGNATAGRTTAETVWEARPLEPITSTRNARIVEAVKLSQRKHRRRQGRFLVEGLQIIAMALENGATPLEVFVTRSQFHGDTAPKLLATMEHKGARITEIAANVMARLSDREEPQGLVVAFALLQADLADIVGPRADGSARADAPAPSLIVILDRLQDPGNLGTLIRTADAVGALGIVLIEPCVDRFDSKTVSASMGSLFSLPIVLADDPEAVVAALAKWTVVGADAHEGDLAWEGAGLEGSVALVLGNEARGLSPDLRPHVARWVRLPIVGKAESLNVAVAGGALAYEWLRRNRPPP